MNMPTIIAVIALAAMVFFAVRYLVKAKKSGAKCIGCAVEGSCRAKKLQKELGGTKDCCH